MPTDATLEFLDRLNDPSQWVVRRSVPVFKAHKRKARDGRTIEVSEGDLETIAGNMRQLEREQGVVGRITPGHIKQSPDAAEDEQPTLYGFMRNARGCAPFGPKRERAVLVDCYYFPEHAAAAARYPFRSAEYYDSSKEIRGLALLKRDPFLDLGVVTYDRPSGAYLYAMGGGAMADGIDEVRDEIAATTDHTLTLDEQRIAERYMKYFRCKYAIDERPRESVGRPEPNSAGTIDNDSLAIRYSRLEAEVLALKDQNTILAADRERAVCEQLVTQLEAEGYQLDRAFEVEELLQRGKSGRGKYLENLRLRYKKVPGGPMVALYQGKVESGAAEHQEDIIGEKALQYMREHPGTTYDRAKREVGAGKV